MRNKFCVLSIILLWLPFVLLGQKINVTFVFHINQDLTPSVLLADKSCYSGLVDVLLKHKDSSFTLHISGPTIIGLQWLDPLLIKKIREGVRSKQFELLGSTYAQNVMFSTHSSADPLDMTDNLEQIKLHKSVIKNVFANTPVGFWNAERVWRQDFAHYIKQAGYKYTFIQDHIQLKSGVKDEYTPKLTAYKGDTIIIIGDDVQFKDLVNNVIDGRRSPQAVLNYLKRIANKPNAQNYLVVYAEDAEATGFWDFERYGNDPRENWKNLDALLTALESSGFVNITTPSEFLKTVKRKKFERVRRFAFGAADWMEKASKKQGYGNWANFNKVYEPNKEMRALYDIIRQRRFQVEEELKSSPYAARPGLKALIDYSKLLLAAHQFELGSNDNVFSGEAEWERARVALVPLAAVQYFVKNKFGIFEDDVNYDSVKEIIFANRRYFLVLSSYGGKILYWYDYNDGTSLVGSELGTYYKEHFVDDNTTLPRLNVFEPLWGYIKGKEKVYPFSLIKDSHFFIRQHTFLDDFYIDGVKQGSITNARYNYSIKDDSINFLYESKRFKFSKTYTMDTASIYVKYEVMNKTRDLLKMSFQPLVNLVPDVNNAFYGGRDSILIDEPLENELEIINLLSRKAVRFKVSRYRRGLFGEKSLLSSPLKLKYDFSVPPRFRKFFKFSLTATNDTTLLRIPYNAVSCVLKSSDTEAILLNGTSVEVTKDTAQFVREPLPVYKYIPLAIDYDTEMLYFSGSDSTADELLEYPDNPVFEPGSFDLQRASFKELPSHYLIEINIGAPFSDVWGSGKGFSIQAFDVYFNTKQKTNFSEVPLPAREFPSSFKWQYMAFIEGWYPKIFRYDKTEYPIDHIIARGNILKVFVNKDFLDLKFTDGALIFSLGQSDETSNNTYRARRVGENREWNFRYKKHTEPLGFVVDWLEIK